MNAEQIADKIADLPLLRPNGRPPLGVMPRDVWLLHRARDLADAIAARVEYIARGEEPVPMPSRDVGYVRKWTAELEQILTELEGIV